MSLLPLLADDFLEFLKEEPQVIIIALIVVIGLIQGAARTVKKMLNKAGLSDERGLQASERRGGTRRQQRDAVLDADPESLLPPMMRSRVWDQAKQAGVVEDDDEDDEDDGDEAAPQRAHFMAAPAAAPARQRREPARAQAAPIRIRADQLVDEDDHQSVLSGPLVSADVAAPITTHDGDVTLARSLVRRRRPSRSEVRTAILWSEILGPPRALNPYRPPSRRGGGGGGPSSIAIVPLRDNPAS